MGTDGVMEQPAPLEERAASVEAAAAAFMADVGVDRAVLALRAVRALVVGLERPELGVELRPDEEWRPVWGLRCPTCGEVLDPVSGVQALDGAGRVWPVWASAEVSVMRQVPAGAGGHGLGYCCALCGSLVGLPRGWKEARR